MTRTSTTMPRLTARPRPASAAPVQVDSAELAAVADPVRSPVANEVRALASSASGVVPHRPSRTSGSDSSGRAAAAAS